MQETLDILTRMIVSHGWSPPILLDDQDMSEFSGSSAGGTVSYREVLRRFRCKLGVNHVDEIYYAHDIGGRVPELTMNAFPMAERIMFGDGLGSVYNKTYHMALVTGASLEQARQALRKKHQVQGAKRRFSLRGIRSFVKKLIRDKWLGSPKPFQADKAVLILPMDQTGTSLEGMELIVVPKQQVQEVIAECQNNLPDLVEYIAGLLADGPRPFYLILLANIADGNLTSKENETGLYEEIIRRHVPPQSAVFIKGHPLSVMPVDEMLCERLAGDYFPKVLPHKFSRYPIELWSDLIGACTVIGVSYSVISLAFLYDIRVVFPFDDALIEKYIPSRFWGFYKDADRLYRGQLENLKDWDGRSVLWEGHID
ncbi:MAG: hypothetical protein NTW69_00790 [Chloroflexi bacterium]|nr:hypothetical protein [Chloroflexota bacterium]